VSAENTYNGFFQTGLMNLVDVAVPGAQELDPPEGLNMASWNPPHFYSGFLTS
jgi:hypothetical protein